MKIDYKFKYRSKVCQNLWVILQNLLISLCTVPVFPLLDCIAIEFDIYLIDDNFFYLYLSAQYYRFKI